MAGHEHRVEPLQGDHTGADGRTDRELHPVDARCRIRDQLHAALARAGGLGHGTHVAECLAEGLRVEREDLRMGGDALRQLRDFGVGDGAHRAQRLGDDQIWLQGNQSVLVELVDRLALLCARAHRRVDLAGAQSWGQDVAGDVRKL